VSAAEMGCWDDTPSCCILIYSPPPSYPAAPLKIPTTGTANVGAGTLLVAVIPAWTEGARGGSQGAGFDQMET